LGAEFRDSAGWSFGRRAVVAFVPADWIRAVLQPRLQTTWTAQYGYHWYLDTLAGHHLVAGLGNGGQRLVILPDLDLTVAITAGNYDDPNQGRTPLTVIEQVILPATT
jgi:CubicO group peptidase (beta-lactamase class C family)